MNLKKILYILEEVFVLQKGFFVVEVVHLQSQFPLDPHEQLQLQLLFVEQLQLQLQLPLLLIKSILFETSVPIPLRI